MSFQHDERGAAGVRSLVPVQDRRDALRMPSGVPVFRASHWTRAPRERDGEGRSAVVILPGVDRTAVRLDDALRDREPDAEPVRLRRHEWREERRHDGRRQSRPGIRHRNNDVGGSVLAADRDVAFPLRRVGQRIHRIPDAAHWVQNEAAEEVNRVVVEFLSRR